MPKPRIFLSLASNEFAQTRTRLAAALKRGGCDVEVQHHFPQTATDTIEKLADFISHPLHGPVDLVVHVAGNDPGSVAAPQAVNDFLKRCAETQPFLADHPDLRNELGDFQGITYTQWEALLAIHYQINLLAYRTTGPETADSKPHSQQTHLDRLYSGNRKFPGAFKDDNELCDQVMSDVMNWLQQKYPNIAQKWRASLAKPNNLTQTTLGPLFKGRGEFLKEIGNRLWGPATGQSAAPDSQPQQTKRAKATVISGSGGIGKTRAALEYAWENEARYSALLFVSADATPESPATLETSLGNLTTVLNIPDMQKKTDDIRLQAVLNWLAINPGWLAILDNADTRVATAAIEQRLPQLAAGHVLITSRLAAWPDDVERLPLEVLDLESATQYLLLAAADRAPAVDDLEQAQRAAERVGRLALGLEHAAAYINNLGISFAEYLQTWEQDEAAILREFDVDRIKYPRELLVTWKLSADRLSDPARSLLSALSWFATDPIPESILAKIPADYLSIPPEKALAELAKFSLVTRDPASRSFQLHGLVQATTRYHLKQPGQAAEQDLPSLEAALQWINACIVDGSLDVRNWPVLDPLAPHALAVCQHADSAGKTTAEHATSRLLNQIGLLFQAKANYHQAEPLYRRALAIDEQSYGAEHPNVALRLNNLGALLKDMNQLVEAEQLMRRALNIFENCHAMEHPDIVSCATNLASLLHEMNCLTEAEQLMRRALAIDDHFYGPEHPNVARDLSNLALLLKDINHLEEAERLMRRALAIDERSYRAEHPTIANRLNNLGLILLETNQNEEAEQMMHRALSIDEQAYGAEHPIVANRLSNLAQVLRATKQMEKAEDCMRRALKIDKHVHGLNHPLVAIRLNNLAGLLRDTNRCGEAEPMYESALQIFEQAYGFNHPQVATCLNELVLLFKRTNRLAQCEPLMRRALAIFEASLGEDHPNTQLVRENLAILEKELAE